MSWWSGDPSEIYWCEITDRDDVGTDLKCPQTNERGNSYWSYDLINGIWPGDIVFHYSTKAGVKAFVGASVAGGPVGDRPIVWTPHGTIGRSKPGDRAPRPGWWLPLHGYRAADIPLRRADLLSSDEQAWIRAWITEKDASSGHQTKAPFQLYPGEIRASQGYLTKMPRASVERWRTLTAQAEGLSALQDNLSTLGESAPPKGAVALQLDPSSAGIKLKSDAPYEAAIRASVQHRSRNHERLVREAVGWLSKRGAIVSTPHPIDLFVSAPVTVILEAELAATRGVRAAVREAVGQLHDYRWFHRLTGAALCILLDVEPGAEVVEYVESYLGLFLVWRGSADSNVVR